MKKLIASTVGLGKIKQARKEKGWNIDDSRWLESASEVLGVSWEKEGKLASGISYGTWKRFLGGKHLINDRAFQAYCQVLGLEWQSVVVEESDRQEVNLSHQDWGDAIDVSVFFGRQEEIVTLRKWIISDRCRSILLLGMGGIGKTALSIKTAQSIQSQFNFVLWRSLRNAPSLENLLAEIIQFVSNKKETKLPETTADKISLLLKYLRDYRCLLILDNAESILASNQNQDGTFYRQGYEDYGLLFKSIAETQHQSCLLITSREKLKEIAILEGDSLSVRCLLVKGLPQAEGKEIFQTKGSFSSSEADWLVLLERYGGNPLALKIVASYIKDFFAGNIEDFLAVLQEGLFIFDDIRDLLKQQFERLTLLEQQIMYWLAINREPVSLQNLQQDFVTKVSSLGLLQSLASLQKRSVIEKFDHFFSQQTVVMEYITHELIVKVTEEIKTKTINLLNQIALEKSQSQDFIRESQETNLIKPIGERLIDFFYTPEKIKKQMQEIIDLLHYDSSRNLKRGYLSGNIINILRQLEIDISGFDFSGLTVWQANLQGIKLHNVNFANADLSKSIFTETLGNILSATFSPDGQTLATCDTDCQIRLWEVTTGKLLVICKGHQNWVRSVAFSPDGQILASGGADRTVKFWQVSDGSCLKTCCGHENEIFSVTFSPDNQTLVSASGDSILRLWNFRTGECIKTFVGHTGWVRTVAFSPDGKMLASGSDDQTLRIWDVATGECLRICQEHSDGVKSVAFSPDGKIIASGSGDRTVKLWSVSTGECFATYDQHTSEVSAVAFSCDGVTLASGSGDRTVRLWNYHTRTCIRTIYGHTNQIFSLAFSPQGRTIVCVSLDQTVRIWDCYDGKCLKTWQGSTDWVFPVAISTNGTVIASGSNDYTVRIWEWESNTCTQILSGHYDHICALAFHPQLPLLASSSRDRTIRLWDLETTKCIQILSEHEDWVYAVAFSPDGMLLASGGADTTAKLWDLETGKCCQTLSEHTNQVWSVAFSPDRQILATSDSSPTIRLWDIKTGELWQTLIGHKNRVTSVAFSPLSPTERILASGSMDDAIVLWDYQKGELILTLKEHENWVFSIAISPDGQTLASASHDQTMRLWDVKTGECLHICQGHDHLVSSVAFHPHGQIVASGSQDQTVRLWDVKTGECLQILKTARLYEGMNINAARGLTSAQKATFKTLGAIE